MLPKIKKNNEWAPGTNTHMHDWFYRERDFHRRDPPLAFTAIQLSILVGGGGGIRTPGAIHSAVFKTAALNHSATPPVGGRPVLYGSAGPCKV